MSRRGERRWRSIIHPLGVVSVAAGLATVLIGVQSHAGEAPPKPQFLVNAPSADELDIAFTAGGAAGVATVVDIYVTGGTIASVPDSWSCRSDGAGLMCSTPTGTINEVLSVQMTASDTAPTYRVAVHATAGEYRIDGVRTGRFPSAPD